MMGLPKQTMLGLGGPPGLRGMSDFTPSRPAKYLYAERLVVAGGAGGCSSSAGSQLNGGSGGGAVSIEPIRLLRGTYTVTVGAGGAAGANGSPSRIDHPVMGNIITLPGGAVGGLQGSSPGSNGGCGGGGAGGSGGSLLAYGVATDQRYGFDGAPGDATSQGGGGGGAGGAGGYRSGAVGGAGGAPVVSDFTGSSVAYGAGSGANGTNAGYTAGASGTNAGTSTSTSTTGGNGVANTGGAGGCAGYSGGTASGGTGGSGVVAFRYRGDLQIAQGGTVTFAAGWRIHTFTSGVGSFVVP